MRMDFIGCLYRRTDVPPPGLDWLGLLIAPDRISFGRLKHLVVSTLSLVFWTSLARVLLRLGLVQGSGLVESISI